MKMIIKVSKRLSARSFAIFEIFRDSHSQTSLVALESLSDDSYLSFKLLIHPFSNVYCDAL